MKYSDRTPGGAAQPIRNVGFDLLRVIGVALVFLIHFEMYNHLIYQRPLIFGRFLQLASDLIMDLFFVNSGYLVAHELFKSVESGRSAPLRRFYIRRAFRILPAYIAVLTVVWAVSAYLNLPRLPLWRFLTFTMNFVVDLRKTQVLPQVWSLCVEEHFYLLLPILFLFLRRCKLKSAAILFGVSIGFEIVLRSIIWTSVYSGVQPPADHFTSFLDWSPHFGWPTYTHLDGIIFGVALAGCRAYLPLIWNRILHVGHYWLGISTFLLGLNFFAFDRKETLWGTAICYTISAMAFSALNVYAIILNKHPAVRKLPTRLIAYLSALTFPVYLVHFEIIKVVTVYFRDLEAGGELLLLAISAVMAVGAGAFLHYVVEQPSMRHRDRILARIDRAGAIP